MNIRQIVLASRPIGFPKAGNFRIEEKVIGNIKEGEVLLKSWFISVDPYMRGRMSDAKSYAVPYQVNDPIAGSIVAKVIESKSTLFREGDIVVGTLPWATNCIEDAAKLRKIDVQAAPPSYHLGILGMPGLTAYIGLMDIGKPRAGETVVVSGAAGAVGIVAGQIASIQGCNVVGIAGSDEKCKLLKEKFRFNEAVNYKTAKNIKKSISTACPDGVDVYFDNVGGEITRGVFDNLNFHSRIVVCGQISQYNNTRFEMVPDMLPKVLGRSILIQGFIVRNYGGRYEAVTAQLSQWLKEGALNYRETIVRGFDMLPETFLGLFSGKNQGKMLVETE